MSMERDFDVAKLGLVRMARRAILTNTYCPPDGMRSIHRWSTLFTLWTSCPEIVEI
jgi:hypothetical protein